MQEGPKQQLENGLLSLYSSFDSSRSHLGHMTLRYSEAVTRSRFYEVFSCRRDPSSSWKMDSSRYIVVLTPLVLILVTWHSGIQRLAQSCDFSMSFGVMCTQVTAGQWTLNQRKKRYLYAIKFPFRGGSAQNLTILVNNEIIPHELDIRHLFHSFVKTLTYSVFHLTPILFRGGVTFYRVMIS